MAKNDLIKNHGHDALSNAFDVDKLNEVLEDASATLGRESKWTKKTSFAPSSFYPYGNGVCPRYYYYAFNGAMFEYENTARQRANMDAGTAAGDRIAKLFDAAGILKDSEVEVVHEDPPIRGFMDLLAEWQGEEMVGEVKTTTTESWAIRQAQMKAPGYQLLQLLIYMHVFNKNKGFFVIENKNDHGLLIVPVLMNDNNKKIVEDLFDWMRMVHKNSLEGELPKRPFVKSSLNCKSCPVRNTCWEGVTRGKVNGKDPNPGTIELPVLEVPK